MLFDVAIIGAGPAGTSAAYHLEKSGLKIIILDKENFPRSKTCAGVIPPRIFSEVSVPEEVVERPLDGYRIHSPSGIVLESPFPRPGIIVRREKFDFFLLKRLECPLKKMKVEEYVMEDEGVSIRGNNETISAKYAVMSYGASSILDDLIPGKERRKKNMALGCQFEISLDEDIVSERIGNWFEVFYTISYGYGWISPHKDRVKVGIGGISEDIRKNGKKVLSEFMELDSVKGKIEGGRIEKFEAHQIPMGGPYPTLSLERTLLCGDAGGFVFPGTGEGIYYAIKSGRFAAKTITQALKENHKDPDFLKSKYQSELEKNGLISLRDVDFINEVLSSEEGAKRYVKRLKNLSIRSSGP